MTDNRRFHLTEEYKGNQGLPISDAENGYNELMMTEVVYILNHLYEQNKLRKQIIKYLVDYIKIKK